MLHISVKTFEYYSKTDNLFPSLKRWLEKYSPYILTTLKLRISRDGSFLNE